MRARTTSANERSERDVNVLEVNKTERCGVQNSAATNTSLVEAFVGIDMKTQKKKYNVDIERETKKLSIKPKQKKRKSNHRAISVMSFMQL